MTAHKVIFNLMVLLESKMTKHMIMTRTNVFGYFSIYMKKRVYSKENLLLKKALLHLSFANTISV